MTCNCSSKCVVAKIAWVLVLVGALNWGLVGAGMLAHSNWNLVQMLLGSWPMVEAIVYLLVGISAIVSIVGCPCKKCKEGACASCAVEDKKAM